MKFDEDIGKMILVGIAGAALFSLFGGVGIIALGVLLVIFD